MPSESAARQRLHATCVLRHLFAAFDERDPVRLELTATLERVNSPRAVEQVLSTLLSWTAGVSGEQLTALDRDLAEQGLTTLSQIRDQDAHTRARVLERGRVDIRDEYRAVAALVALEGPLGPSPKERGHLLDLLGAYSESDRESADTAPLALAWRAAARDLEVRFVSPYRISAEGEPEVWCCGVLPDFGGPNGAAILGRFSTSVADALAEKGGHYVSGLSPLYYELYDRSQFQETLNDWGWFGHSSPPTWFTGARMRHGGAALVEPQEAHRESARTVKVSD